MLPREFLLQEHSKVNTMRVAELILANESYFQDLLDCLQTKEGSLSQRAAWVLPSLAEKNASLVKRNMKAILAIAEDESKHVAVRRNVAKILMMLPADASYEDEAVNLCFAWLESNEKATAVKLYSMNYLAGLCSKYPELKAELLALLELKLDQELKGFCAAARKVMKRLR